MFAKRRGFAPDPRIFAARKSNGGFSASVGTAFDVFGPERAMPDPAMKVDAP